MSKSHDGGPAAGAALSAGGGEPGDGALVDHVTFGLGIRGHHGEEKIVRGPVGRGQVVQGSAVFRVADSSSISVRIRCQASTVAALAGEDTSVSVAMNE